MERVEKKRPSKELTHCALNTAGASLLGEYNPGLAASEWRIECHFTICLWSRICADRFLATSRVSYADQERKMSIL